MSRAPRSARSFERIEKADLVRLGELALKTVKRELNAQYGLAELDECEIVNICLCQGAANHYLNHESRKSCGIHDFDVWAFFKPQRLYRFGNKKPAMVDFGPSKFGRSPLDPKSFRGRRIDVFWRAIPDEGMNPGDPILKYLHRSKAPTAQELRKCAVVKVWPEMEAGEVFWNPKNFGAPGTYDPWE